MSTKRELFTAVVSTGLGLNCAVASPAPQDLPLIGPSVRSAKSIQRLGAMLRKLGYSVEPRHNENGEITGYFVSTDSEGRKLEFSIDLENDAVSFRLSAMVQTLPANTKISPLPLMQLLQLNMEIRPAHVCFDESSQQITLRMTSVEFARTVEGLRDQVNEFCKHLRTASNIASANDDRNRAN